MSLPRAPKNARAGAASALATAALLLALAGCGGGSPGPVARSIKTVGASPDIKVDKVVGGHGSVQQEAAIAMELTKNPGPGGDLQPLPRAAFRRPVAEYRAYSERQAGATAAAVARLRGDLRAGDVAGAKGAWLAAYQHYLRLGAAYGALGRLDEEIDGGPGGLPGGVHDPRFTGLHRIEMGLWTGEAPARLLGPAAYLAAKVRRLRAVVRRISISPLAYATRAHEILEDAQRDMLSDVDAPWSGAGLRATAASLAATEFVIGTLRPLLDGRDSTIEPVENELDRFRAVVDSIRREHGDGWPPLDALTRTQRERVDGSLGSLLQRLDDVPAALEVKRTEPVPTIAAQKAERR